MAFRKLALGAAFVVMAGMAAEALAQESLYIPLLTYRTGPYAGSGIPIANGMRDYLTMLNERDGGIGGVKLTVEECETGYDTQKGVECYEGTKGKGALVYNPYSTGITLQLIPKASVDKIPVLSMAYGLSASAIGKAFPWVFNPPRHLLGRRLRGHQGHRRSARAASTSSPARRSASSSSMPATAASRSRSSSSWRKNTATSSSNTRCRARRCRTSPRNG